MTKVAKIEKFDLDRIEKLRKDFLTLTKNIPNLSSYAQLEAFRGHLRLWNGHFHDYIFKRLLPRLKSVGRGYLETKVRTASWSLYLELGNPPIRWDRIKDSYWNWSEQAVFEDFVRNRDKWFDKLRRLARDTWKALKEVEDMLPEDLYVYMPSLDVTEIEGFQVTMKGHDPDYTDKNMQFWEDAKKERLALLRRGLKAYREAASRVYPILIERQLPLEVNFFVFDKDGTAASYYKNEKLIRVNMMEMSGDVRDFVKVMAHEMSHHIFQTHLSGQQMEFWNAAIKADRVDLDLRDVLARWNTYSDPSSFFRDLSRKDPILYIQLMSFQFQIGYESLFMMDREDLEQYLRAGKHPVVKVNTGLSTAYSYENTEEAFCETIGNLVAYGPRTIPSEGMRWVKTILPEIKVASLARNVVAKFQEKG
jgi:hypothetical protein